MRTIKKAILDCKILIIEDDFLGRTILREIFRKQGFTNIEEAENGIDGIEKIQSFLPNLVIMDVIMPKMDGVECCKLIRKNANPQIANVPILIQTALDRLSDKTRLFEAGATDYIIKPIDPHEITARAIVHLEREIITNRLWEFNDRVAQELSTARATQKIIIPNAKIISEAEKKHGLEISACFQPSSELGGDFWGFNNLSQDELAIYIADFSGHGVNAALNVFRLHALMQTSIDTARFPAAHLTHLNAILSPMLPIGQFATMFYGVINRKNNSLYYASAASPPPLLFSKKQGDFQSLDAGGTLLGAASETIYTTTEITFETGDFLLLYSDALIETANKDGEFIPIEYWAEILKSNLKPEQNSCKESFLALLEYFNQNCATQLNDDLTLSAYCRTH